MSNRATILDLIRRRPGLTDREIRDLTGIEPHQQVNQICRRLAADGLTERRHGASGRIINLPRNRQPAKDERSDPVAQPRRSAEAFSRYWGLSLDPPTTLLVLPCSGRKRSVASSHRAGRSAMGLLPEPLRRELEAVRERVASMINLDRTEAGPAIEVYNGTLYSEGRDGVEDLEREGASVLIISGGYGVLAAHETIRGYNQVFRPGMWPEGLIGRCLAAVAETLSVSSVIGFLSSSTAYAKVFRDAPWLPDPRVQLLSPERTTGGAQVKAPRALGEALSHLAAGHQIDSSWSSSDGLGLEVASVA